jgi:hypothetical protein
MRRMLRHGVLSSREVSVDAHAGCHSQRHVGQEGHQEAANGSCTVAAAAAGTKACGKAETVDAWHSMSARSRMHTIILVCTMHARVTQQVAWRNTSNILTQHTQVQAEAAVAESCCCYSQDIHVAATSDCFTCRCKQEVVAHAHLTVSA